MIRDTLSKDFMLPGDPLPLKHGRIILVRFIRSNLMLDVFGEKFLMPKHLEYSYVVTLIDIERELLLVLRDDKIEWRTHYQIVQSTM